MDNPTSKLILVTGDPICDNSFYKGNRPTADSQLTPGFRPIQSGGGALLLNDLIVRVIDRQQQSKQGKGDAAREQVEWKTEFGLNSEYENLPTKCHAFAFWEPQDANVNGKSCKVWRATEPPMGYGEDAPTKLNNGKATRTRQILPRDVPLSAPPEILVIDDAAIGFRDAAIETCWPWPYKDKSSPGPSWVVTKMTGPFGQGKLWTELLARCDENLILIVSADQLRRSDVRISRGLSWEATAEDLTAELHGNPMLKPLLAARHLIVTFKSDAAYWLDNNPDSTCSMLVFDAVRAEGEWSESQGEGTAFGFLSCFTAAIVRELCRSKGTGEELDFEEALGAGLEASRHLRQLGHGPVTIRQKREDGTEREVDNPNPGFPFDEIAEAICNRHERFASVRLPQDSTRRGEWMMLDDWQIHARSETRQRPHHGAAYAVAMVGPGALERFPVAHFGGLQTADRMEIESLRTIRQLIRSYDDVQRQKKPLNLGVFGPPGAGKSFGVTQIAMSVLNLKRDDILTFNLSQFRDPSDLNGAFHQVRDRVLTGVTPLVFWDEFDSKGYQWLQYLLAPMQDGTFQDGQITHPIGKCVFVFAGATSPTYDTFGPCNPDLHPTEESNAISPEQHRDIEAKWLDFVLKKGPDFRSRLVGYMNVLGPNQRQKCEEKNGRRYWTDDETDLCFPIRRALFVRSQFGLKDGIALELDTGVLHGLLEVPHYKQGARSLEFLCLHLRERANAGIPRRSHLPAQQLLGMHIDAAAFWAICERDLPILPHVERFARGFHEDWRKNPASAGNVSNVPWEELSIDMRASNMQQALRIATNLAVLNLQIEEGPALPPAEEQTVRDLISQQVEILAESEHNGWMVERIIAGWRYARIPKKDPIKKLHNLLLPYSQLSPEEKEKDRRPVKGFVPTVEERAAGETDIVDGYVDRLKRVGFRIQPVAPVTIANKSS